MVVAKNKVVSIDYTLTNTSGDVLDTSKGGEPLSYLHGVGGIIPGLENALEGKSSGDALKVSIPPDQAYGEKDPNMVQEVPKEAFSGVPNVAVGMQFRAEGPEGPRIVTVVGVNPTTITVDGNHPLAGQTLHFDVNVVGIRDASNEELSHGHVHGAGGHHH